MTRFLRRFGGLGVAAGFTLSACGSPEAKDAASSSESDFTRIKPLDLAPDEAVLMVLGTNDIHGSFDRLPQLAGYVDATKSYLARTYGDRGTLLLLDAGDATQGTLASNYSEGMLAVQAMSAIGYHAAIAGNHGFDFGPVDWRKDQCLATEANCDPLAALRRSVGAAAFPFLGANVTARATKKTLDFLPPYVLVPHQGRNVAVIGLENHFTPKTTVPENVAALSFSDGKAEVGKIVEDLHREGKADVFVLVMHEGDEGMRDFLQALPKRSDGEPLVAAAIAGHSHRVNDEVAADIPFVQSGANGEMFGAIQLVTKRDRATGRLAVVRDKMQKRAAIPVAENPASFMGQPITPSRVVRDIVSAGQRDVARIADEHLADAPAGISRDDGRISDSPVGNLVADMMRKETGADVAMINGGDVREALPRGEVRYAHLFEVLPKNLALVTVSAMPTEKLIEQVRLSVKSCGRRGALQISGMTLVFRRDCTKAVDGEDKNATLVAILDATGQPIVRGDVIVKPTVRVATTDFVMSGGAGYDRFVGLTPSGDALVLRDEVARGMKALATLEAGMFASGRYVDCTANAAHAACR